MDAIPTPRDRESDADYRARLRVWYEATQTADTPELRRAAWVYLCTLAGIDPKES